MYTLRETSLLTNYVMISESIVFEISILGIILFLVHRGQLLHM